MDNYLVIIDTEQYAGNFERELCAYCTGHVGECEVGDDEADIFEKEEPGCKLFQNVTLEPDENGCHRPVKLYVTPGWWNDGLGSEYPDSEWGKAHTKEKYKKSARESKLKKTSIGHFPAYLSIAILFSDRPSQEEIDMIVKRALKFGKYWKTKKTWGTDVTITGLRVLREHTVVDEIQRIEGDQWIAKKEKLIALGQ